MTLSFSTHWADGSPTYFIPKIWKGIYSEHKDQFHKYCDEQYLDTLKEGLGNFSPKLHTIREDKSDRWEAGNKIHPVINNRTKNRFQFCPTLECKRIQYIKIIFSIGQYVISIDDTDHYIPYSDLEQYPLLRVLAQNDGFDNVGDFLSFFVNGKKKVFEGKIIHWTVLKY